MGLFGGKGTDFFKLLIDQTSKTLEGVEALARGVLESILMERRAGRPPALAPAADAASLAELFRAVDAIYLPRAASPSTEMSMLLVNTVRSSLTERRAITSRPSYVCGNMIRSGESPLSITDFIAAETATPGSLPPRSPVAYTLVAPCSPSEPAMAEASPPANAETEPPADTVRALVSSSSVAVVGAPFDSCANTQMFMVLLR